MAEERRLKDQQENQTEELRTKLTQLESQSGQKEQYEKKLRDLRNELEATRRKLKRAEAKAKETPPLLLELQDEMANMKLQHQAAIFEVLSISTKFYYIGCTSLTLLLNLIQAQTSYDTQKEILSL